MNLQIKLRNREQSFEFFSVGIYSIRKPRLIPSVYTSPHLSVRWLWMTVSISGLDRLEGIAS